MRNIYLDHAASTPVHPEVAAEMLRVMQGQYGNASSIHAFGRAAKRTVNGARDSLAASLGCRPDEVVFTAGGTESDNLALFGSVAVSHTEGKHIITTAVEHHAVLHSCHELEKRGYRVTYLPVDSHGMVYADQVKEAITDDTILISVMYANNEVGTVQPIQEIGTLARERGIVFHVDAVQALGSLDISCSDLPVDLMSFSAHKINGPQGIGALYVQHNTRLEPLLHGGLQERKRRAGTENLAGAAGFARAAQLATADIPAKQAYDEGLRRTFLTALDQHIGKDRYVINGHPTSRLAHILNISFPEVGTETMLMNLDMEGIAAASGSACTSGSLEPSHVLEAMNIPEQVLRSAIRFSFGLGNTNEEMEYTAEKIGTILSRIRNRR
ncbi:cysteine desulfurase family protein [Paenibacillus sp. J22TS3]|uniref:cysteine desulfurase family protein n=1 Tax=Paenibacillus sp. J22TS3 TaxID=2807192 RepID=UPI001B2930DA|nr:cysteine desulfurase family protein [Paenibacillus sp. J22TS3]GIP20779.1 cysteine desulfurase IscS [Paenibacillus sp. J22TS3]